MSPAKNKTEQVNRTIIIDDETHIRDTLIKLLARHCPQMKVVGEAAGVHEGVRLIQTLKPDLVILDINLADGNGFDLLRQLQSIDFKLIFISASDKYLVQACMLSSIEYILKPVNPETLKAAIRKVEESGQQDLKLQLIALEANVT